MSLKKLFLSFSILITSAIAHSTYGQNYSCSCADDIDQFAPIPEQALGVNVTASGVGYVTEELGGGAYGKQSLSSPFRTVLLQAAFPSET